MDIKRENMQILLRCLAMGDRDILMNERDEYVALQVKNMAEFKDYRLVTIESRLQY